MAYIKFGNTWWGEKWLDALSGTDYSNRLPRGQTYARNGSVKQVSISGHDVSADVKGSRPRPYKVQISLPKFSPRHKNAVVEAITENPYFLSQLLNRKLPAELFEVFQNSKIPVFPNTWDDLKASCSCPDWAFCCKHIAAIIYLIANEVDKNPFLLFELHDFDVFEALLKKGYSAEKHSTITVVSSRQLVLKSRLPPPEQLSDDKRSQLFKRLDFTQVPYLRDDLLSLLGNRPLFYLTKDFKPIYEKALKSFAHQMGRQSSRLIARLEANRQVNTPVIYTAAELTVSGDLELDDVKLVSANGTVSTDGGCDYSSLFDALLTLPEKHIHSHHQRVVMLSLLTHFAVKLIEQNAILPEILAVSQGHRIRWMPALINPKVQEIFDTILQYSHGDLVDKPYLERREQVRTVLSGIIGKLICRFAGRLNGVPTDSTTDMFFRAQVLKNAKTFGGQEVPENIALWLANLHIGNKNFVPVVKIDEIDDGFTLDLLVENRQDELSEPVPIRAIVSQKKYAKIKYDVLKDVTRLADYLPEIAQLLATKGEKLPIFSTADFEAVLFRHLPTLQLLTIPILLPKGLDRLIRPRISATITSSGSQATKGYLSLDDMLDFNWQVALGDQLLSAKEFEKLVRGQNGIVKLKDQFVYLDQTEIDKILKRLDAEPRLTPNEAFQSALTGEYDGGRLHLDDNVKRMINELLTANPLPAPETLHANLRDYQQRGFEWLARNAALGFGSLLADDMGLGKTIQIITLLLHKQETGELEDAPALVIVPTSLLTNWRREIEQFAPALKVHTYHGSDRKFATKDIHAVLATYGLLRRDEAVFAKTRWAAVILDEAQAIKNHRTAQAKAARRIKSDIRIAMTGTPVENRLSEYWSIFDFLNKGYLKSDKAFHTEFALPIEVDRNQHKLRQFRTITAPFILRRLKSDKSIIKDLPDKLEIDQFCQLGAKQAALYKSTLTQVMEQIEEAENIERRGLVLKLITALKQVCNHPSHFLKNKSIDAQASGKTALLVALLKTIFDTDEKVLIFTQYTQMGHLLQQLIATEFGTVPLFLHGGLSRKKRDEMVDDFQTKPYAKALLLSLKAGGTGLNLTAAQNVIHFDLWWNPAVEAQATDRAFRIGQTKNVMVHRLISRGTFEEKINDMLKDKRELAELAVAAGEKWIGDYSDSDLREIFALQ